MGCRCIINIIYLRIDSILLRSFRKKRISWSYLKTRFHTTIGGRDLTCKSTSNVPICVYFASCIPSSLPIFQSHSSRSRCVLVYKKSTDMSQWISSAWQRPTLPGPCGPSTIGAGGLNGRVRDGYAWNPSAIATKQIYKGLHLEN